MENRNGKGQMPPLRPEDIVDQVTVVLTKNNQYAIVGNLKDLPSMLQLLGQGILIMSELVKQALPKRIIPIHRPLPPREG